MDMMVIGINVDAPNSVTFHSVATYGHTLDFVFQNNDSHLWGNSIAKRFCQDFYNHCDAGRYILPISKGTCETKSDLPVFTTETVWYPSLKEIGATQQYAPQKYAKEISALNTGNPTYPYYSNALSRIKNKQGTASHSYYWLRTLSTNGSRYVLCIQKDGTANSSACDTTLVGNSPAFVIG